LKIVGVTKCPVGIAYTYLAAEKLEQTGKKLGHEMKIEAQGALGMETPLTMEDIQQADYVILAADTAVAGKDRFAGKKVLKVSLQAIMKNAADVFNSLAGCAKMMK